MDSIGQPARRCAAPAREHPRESARARVATHRKVARRRRHHRGARSGRGRQQKKLQHHARSPRAARPPRACRGSRELAQLCGAKAQAVAAGWSRLDAQTTGRLFRHWVRPLAATTRGGVVPRSISGDLHRTVHRGSAAAVNVPLQLYEAAQLCLARAALPLPSYVILNNRGCERPTPGTGGT